MSLFGDNELGRLKEDVYHSIKALFEYHNDNLALVLQEVLDVVNRILFEITGRLV